MSVSKQIRVFFIFILFCNKCISQSSNVIIFSAADLQKHNYCLLVRSSSGCANIILIDMVGRVEMIAGRNDSLLNTDEFIGLLKVNKRKSRIIKSKVRINRLASIIKGYDTLHNTLGEFKADAFRYEFFRNGMKIIDKYGSDAIVFTALLHELKNYLPYKIGTTCGVKE